MTRDDPTAVLISLVQRVPVLAIDLQAAEARGDHAALAYTRAMTAWRTEAAEAVAEIRQASPVREAPCPFDRIAAASALMRAPAAG